MGAHQKPLLAFIVWRGAEATPTLKYHWRMRVLYRKDFGTDGHSVFRRGALLGLSKSL